MKTELIKMLVAGWNSNGEPDMFFCVVRCTDAQYEAGDHYTTAVKYAVHEGYEASSWSADQYDPCFPALGIHFEWATASVIDCNEY